MQRMLAKYEGAIDAEPQEERFHPDHLDRLDDHFAGMIEANELQAAAYLIARNGRIIAHRSMGKLNCRADSPDMLPDSIRKVYSMTKAITAAAILQLVDSGKLRLDQSVSEWIPEFQTDLHRRINVFHLLTHTSGLRGDPGINFEPYQVPWFVWWLQEYRKRNPAETISWLLPIVAGPLVREPGREWIYNTAGYAVLGDIITRASGTYCEDYIMDRIVRPLGMDRTFFDVPEHLRANVCYTEDWEAQEIDHQAHDRTAMPPRTGNGLYSTLNDLWKFGQMLLNKGEFDGTRILSKRAVEMLTTNQLRNVRNECWDANSHNYRFGLGLTLDEADLVSPGTFGHEGHGHCGFYADPLEQLVYIFFVPSPQGYIDRSVIAPRAIVWSGIQ